jgi:S-adenosylmethionine:diacylglycerol 3-amino-3-carboxypropyl transferase
VKKGNTAWKRGRLDAIRGKKQLLFGRMYEDASIELNAFKQRGRIMCIASAGCTAMKLAPHHNEIIAVDINPKQIAYAQRRFNGEIGYKGRTELIMGFIRLFSPLIGWWKSNVKEFVELDSPGEQMYYWNRHLNTRRFRNLFDLVFSKKVLGRFYSSDLLNVLPNKFGEVMRYRMERCFSRHSNKKNPYVRMLLLGEFNTDLAPPEAQQIKLIHSDALYFLENVTPGSFNGFTLSNILDGADDIYQQELIAAVKRVAAPGAMMVLRSFSDIMPNSKDNRAGEDRSMLWGSVLVKPASEL